MATRMSACFSHQVWNMSKPMSGFAIPKAAQFHPSICSDRSFNSITVTSWLSHEGICVALTLMHALCIAQVEDEMRELLSVMEQQKAASAVKVRQLATILQDMQAPGLHWVTLVKRTALHSSRMLSLLYTYIPNAVFINDVAMLPHPLDGGKDAHAIRMCKRRTMQSSQAGRGIIFMTYNNVMQEIWV